MLILLVEDNLPQQKLISKVIQRTFPDAEIVAFVTGEDAIKFIDSRVPDLAVLDIMLPGISGYHVLKYLRTKGEVPAVIVSNVSEAKVHDNLDGTNSYYYMSKTDNLMTKLPVLIRSAYDIVHNHVIDDSLVAIEQACCSINAVRQKYHQMF